MPHDLQPEGTYGAPVGRYIQLELGGAKHRIYFEEATCIPVLLQLPQAVTAASGDTSLKTRNHRPIPIDRL